MDRSWARPWILALALAACRNDSGSSELVVRSISAPDFGRWECNRPIEFVFSQRIDFASVSERSIQIRTAFGAPAVGTFAAKAIDANGDGLPERTDEHVVVFYPSCPVSEDLSDAGFIPGVRYLVALAGEDTVQDPDSLLRSVSGNALAQTVVQAFETIADPASTLFDEKPGAPMPLVRAAGTSAGPGCHLELGEDPSNQVYFEAASGRAPSGFAAPLDLLGDPATHVAFVVVFDQSIRTTPANLARLRLEYITTLGASGWIPLETRAELIANCRPDEVAVRLVPLGTFPPGGFVRVRIEAGFQDLAGEATSAPLDEFAIAEVAPPVPFTSLDPPGAIADGIREEFDFGAASPRSLADPAAPEDAVQALWGQGELRSNVGFAAPPPALREFDWIVQRGTFFVFDTASTDIQGGPDGVPTTVQSTRGGFVEVRNFVVEDNATLRVLGPNPMVLHASGSVTIRGTIEANGATAQSSPAGIPAVGAHGSAGGGDGGSGSPGAGPRGGDGSSAFGAGVGGRGGESGFAPLRLGIATIRGGGGGGGRFARDQGMLVAGNGEDGAHTSRGAESGLQPPRGGAAGPEIFVDGDPSNDFFGTIPVVDATGSVVDLRAGELGGIHPGSGGGNGGDSIDSDVFPPRAEALVLEGGGGGGGGGALAIHAVGRIRFGPLASIRANGGRGASGVTSGGSGSGGHVILESATAIDFTDGNPLTSPTRWISAIGGPGDQQGFGAGGPGVVQLHVPHPERALIDPSSNVILPFFARQRPDPFAGLCEPRPNILYPTTGARSSARSRWIPLGAAGEESAARAASTVAMLFDGIETAPGKDQGRVRTSEGRVIELAPLVGPTSLVQPGVELSPDGISLALSGPVLAPLRASAKPISPDVYLRTTALLVGFTLRLANAADPGRRGDFTIAGARYDDAASRLTLTLGELSATVAEEAAELGGPDQVELALVPRFFRVRQGSVPDLLPDSVSVRILFQGAADDGTGRPDELDPLVDWTADVSEFDRLAPGALDFVRFRVEFDLDADGDGFDPGDEPLALDFLRLPMRF